MCGGSKKAVPAPKPKTEAPDPSLAADAQQREAMAQQQANAARVLSSTDSQVPAGSVLGG
jgi:hypothetical protein